MKLVLSIEEASKESGLSVMTVRRAIKTRRLPVVRIGRRIIIQREDWQAFLRGERPPQSRPLTDSELADKIAALSGSTHGETPPAPMSDASRIANALEAIVAELAAIRVAVERSR